MKTTIELPEELFLQAKRCALEQGTTLKALMESGLRNALAQVKKRDSTPYRFPVIDAMAQPAASTIELNALIDQMREEQSARLLR